MSGRVRRVGAVAVIVGAMALGGCEPFPGAVQNPSVVLEGAWRACVSNGAADLGKTMQFFPDSYGLSTATYGTTNQTCGGTATGSSYAPWRYTLGKEVLATLGAGGTTVTARTIDMMNSYVTIYSIVYVDRAATPAMMYFGDLAADPALDGTAASKRPNVLATASAFSGL